jgi:hypothetical protein
VGDCSCALEILGHPFQDFLRIHPLSIGADVFLSLDHERLGSCALPPFIPVLVLKLWLRVAINFFSASNTDWHESAA